MTSRTRLLAILVSAPIIAFAVIGGFLGNVMARTDDTYANLRVFQDVRVAHHEQLCRTAEHGKRHARRHAGPGRRPRLRQRIPTQPQVRQARRRRSGGTADVGITLTHQYYPRVVSARDDSPAARAGIRPGDFVRVVDLRPTRDMSAFEGQRLLAGAPGLKVELTVIRGSSASGTARGRARARNTVHDRREEPHQGDGIGYLRIASFGRRAGDQLRPRSRPSRRGRRSADYRCPQRRRRRLRRRRRGRPLVCRVGNPCDSRVSSHGPGRDRGREGRRRVTLPVTVLVDSGTSGPAEVFAAALAGNKRADLIGERTIGRTGSQELMKLPDGSGLWITRRDISRRPAHRFWRKAWSPTSSSTSPRGLRRAGAADAILQRAIDDSTPRRPHSRLNKQGITSRAISRSRPAPPRAPRRRRSTPCSTASRARSRRVTRSRLSGSAPSRLLNAGRALRGIPAPATPSRFPFLRIGSPSRTSRRRHRRRRCETDFRLTWMTLMPRPTPSALAVVGLHVERMQDQHVRLLGDEAVQRPERRPRRSSWGRARRPCSPAP